MSDNTPLSHQLYKIGLAYADALAAAQMLEEGKSAFVAQRISQQGDIAHNAAERIVKASEEYSKYIKNMVRARQQANRIKAELEYIKAQLVEWQSAAANERLVARLG